MSISKRIVELLGFGDTKVIAKYITETSVSIDDNIIGIVFPVYSQTIPKDVQIFLKKLNFTSNPYIFSIATNNGGPGRANFDIEKILKAQHHGLNSGFTIKMPGNSIIIKDFTNDIDEQQKRLLDTENKVIEITKYIRDLKNNIIEGDKSLKWFLEGKITSLVRRIYNLPKQFHVDSLKCSKCKVCVKICPRNNITLDQSIVFGRDCSNCLACYHWCPYNAITLKSKVYKQYHNPNITVKELFLR